MSATPIDYATPALREASGDVLLDAIVQLTHRIHATRSDPIGLLDHANALREQRALIRAELLRRIGTVSS